MALQLLVYLGFTLIVVHLGWVKLVIDLFRGSRAYIIVFLLTVFLVLSSVVNAFYIWLLLDFGGYI